MLEKITHGDSMELGPLIYPSSPPDCLLLTLQLFCTPVRYWDILWPRYVVSLLL